MQLAITILKKELPLIYYYRLFSKHVLYTLALNCETQEYHSCLGETQVIRDITLCWLVDIYVSTIVVPSSSESSNLKVKALRKFET